MNKPSLVKLLSAIVAFLLLLPEISNAATEYATFDSFYRPSSNVIWILAGAGIAAIIGGAVIFFTGGAASPVVAGVGTWLGGLMGYSGIAATNAGLALLGGGSIASGGFGVIGGTALLTAAFSFGTGVVIDYAAGKAVETYDYSKFVENSKNMVTLPLPENTSGPDSYKAALKVLKKSNQDESLSTNHNQAVIQEAVKTIGLTTQSTLSMEDKVKEKSLLALLSFISNDYVAAKKHADAAYHLALNTNLNATLPAFIYATSSMYDEKPDFKKVTKFFNYAIINEPDNPITPLLFAVYLDRIMYRLNDGYLPPAVLDQIYSLSKTLPYDERKAVIQLGILSRNFIAILLEQQKILSLTHANKKIKDSPKTLGTVQGALKEYESLLVILKTEIGEQSKDLDSRLRRDPSTFDKLRGKGIQQWETQWGAEISKMRESWSKYSKGVAELESRVKELERYQAELERARLEKVKSEPVRQAGTTVNHSGWGWWSYMALMFTTLSISVFLFRKRAVIP